MRHSLMLADPIKAIGLQIDLKNTTVKVKDGTGTPNEVTITIGEGNLVVTERRNIEYHLDRGNLDDVREGDQVPVDVRFEAKYDYITGNTNATVYDAITGTGQASAWVSSDADACRPYAVDIEATHAPTPITCGDQEAVTISDFRWEEINFDWRTGQISFTGKANVTNVTTSRQAQS
jgi:hypothetical protein